MKLKDFFTVEAVNLNLDSDAKDDLLKELVSLLELDSKSESILFKTLVANRLRLAYGRKPQGVDFNAIDGQPVHHFFLIVAPPLEVSNQYLPVLGRIAQFAKDPEVPERLLQIENPQAFLELLEEKGA